MSNKSSGGRARKKREKIKRNLRQFVLTPIIVCVLLCAALVSAAVPVAGNLISIGKMFLQNQGTSYSRSYDSIFTPSDNNSDTVDASEVKYPTIDKQFGTIKIDGRDVDAKLFFGDGSVPLRNGVGVYAGSFIPGYGKTILVAGHNNTWFNGLKNVKKGDIVEIKTSYGNYKYKVKSTAIKKATDKTAYDLKAEEENLILYTCYPFDELGLTEYRFFVYADKISGPQITGIYE